MSESTQTHPQANKSQIKNKGLGRGLGSLLGSTSDGAFSKTTPPAEDALQSLTSNMPSQSQTSIREGFVETQPEQSTVAAPVSVTQPVVPNHLRVWQIPIEKIFPNPNQPRQIFDKEALDELASSIREKGIIQPLLVRKTADGDHELIAGERRWRAAQLAGLKDVPALIKDSGEQEVLELALIENIQRQNLNAIEEAEAYDFLIKKYNLTQNDLAQKVGKDRATVANMLRILQLQPGIRQMVSRGELSLGQAKVLLSVTDAELQQKLAGKAKNESLSVRALEKLAAKAKISKSEDESAVEDERTKAARSVGEELQKLIGSKVVLDYSGGKGQISIKFYSDAELNQIVDTLRDAWRN